MRVIAHLRCPLQGKFGVPRQSGLVSQLQATVEFLPDYAVAEALRGIESWSHLWLVWVFDRAVRAEWSPTVRPPRLGGNTRMGVFATRSPFRPNPIGLSAVRLLGVEHGENGALALRVSGADLADGTPILDIKPYLPYADCLPEAGGGFVEGLDERRLQLDFPAELQAAIPQALLPGLLGVLSRDPRPAYQHSPERVYGLSYAGQNVRFTVEDGVLRVISIGPEDSREG